MHSSTNNSKKYFFRKQIFKLNKSFLEEYIEQRNILKELYLFNQAFPIVNESCLNNITIYHQKVQISY